MRATAVLLCAAAFAALACQPAGSQTVTSLNGTWELLPDTAETYTFANLPAGGWRPVRVPLSIQAQFPDLRDFTGAAWYRKSFTVAETASAAAGPARGSADQHWLLRFGAVDYLSEATVNGVAVGRHEGGYTPFVLDVTNAIHIGANQLILRVTDPPGPLGEFKASYRQIPHGKQNWYVQTSGIWQDVTLEQKPAYYMEAVRALTDGTSMRGLQVQIAHPERIPAGAKASVEIETPGGTAFTRRAPLPSGVRSVFLRFLLDHQQPWSPATPNLYGFRVTLPNGDSLSDHFGFRTIETRAGKLYLNGKPLYMIGALDQDFYPEGVYTPPSLAFIMQEMRLGKSLGLNTLRCHIKVPDPRYLEAADRTGMLIWYEIPNWDDLTPLSQRRGQETLAAMIERDANHPSVIIHSIINESWGLDMKQAGQRSWLAEMYAWAKPRVGNRLVDDNSACCDNFHVATDLADFHQYYSSPDYADEWERWVEDYAGRPAWVYSKYGDARTSRQEPLIVSEFGNWGLPQLPAELPWWFSRNFNGRELTLPAGVHERFAQFGLSRVFHDYATLAMATQGHEGSSLAHEITAIRRQPAIQGYVITEFSDINWESNGLISMWREPKAFRPMLAALQQPVVVLATTDRPNYAPGEHARLELAVSNYSPAALTGVSVSASGVTARLGVIAAGSVASAGTVEIPITQRATRLQTILLELRDGKGTLLNSRELSVAVVAPVSHGAAAVALGDVPASDTRRLATALARRGYQVGDSGVLLTSHWNPAAQAAAESSRAVIVLASSEDALNRSSTLHIVRRTGDLRGDWISNFTWLDTTRSPFSSFKNLGPICNWEAKNVAPRWLLEGIAPEQYGDVIAGMFFGWIHDSHAIALKANHGSGRVIVTTFNLLPHYGSDAYATAVLDSLIGAVGAEKWDARFGL